MQVRLEVIRGAKTREMQLRLPSVIGRGGQARLKVPASTVSRHHCEIYEFEGEIAVRDLGSSNGTIVNGHKINGPTFLTPEDELTIGPITARVRRLAKQPDQPTAAPASTPLEDVPTAKAPQPDEAAVTEDDIPTFEELPVEVAEPIVAEPIVTEEAVTEEAVAEEAVTEEAVEAEPIPQASVVDVVAENSSDGDSESVLHYTEPQESTGRSFVGISTEEATPQAVDEVPVFDDTAEEKPQVKSDDTSLNAFFNNLDD